MAIESFSLVGSQMSPIQWYLAALMLALIPISLFKKRRIIPLAIILPIFGFLVALMRLPFQFYMFLDIGAFFVGIGAMKPSPQTDKPRQPFNPANSFIFMVPFVTLMFSNSNRMDIKIEPNLLIYESGSKLDELSKTEVDVRIWHPRSGNGNYFGIYSPKGYEGLIASDDTYWTGHGFASGEQLIAIISNWSGIKPREYVKGSSPRWPNPPDKDHL